MTMHRPFLFLIMVTGLLLSQQLCDGKVMMEYIGASGNPVNFEDVPIEDRIDFYFLLGFAVDSDNLGNTQNGKFQPYWAKTITPDSVSDIKEKHPNVKVLASLAGWSIGEEVIRWYDPEDTQVWISNAFSSIKHLIKKYHLDGIDIDYESFPRRNTTFAYCIGELITLLKNKGAISVATIAPFYRTAAPYIQLFRRYSHVIDYVNHQFYTDKIRTSESYLEAFKLRATQFDETKLLPSYEIDGRGLQGDLFFEALSLLEKNGFAVNGIMVYSADESAAHNYRLEKKSQDFLLNSSSK